MIIVGKYEEVEFEIIRFDTEDVIATSCTNVDEEGGEF